MRLIQSVDQISTKLSESINDHLSEFFLQWHLVYYHVAIMRFKINITDRSHTCPHAHIDSIQINTVYSWCMAHDVHLAMVLLEMTLDKWRKYGGYIMRDKKSNICEMR